MAQAIADVPVHAKLHALLHHVHGRNDRVVADRGRGAAKCCAHGLVLATLHQQPLLRPLIAREEGDVRRDATGGDCRTTAHKAKSTSIPRDTPDHLHNTWSWAAFRPQSLHVGLHGVQRIHSEVLHHARTTAGGRMLPQRCVSLVPFLPLLKASDEVPGAIPAFLPSTSAAGVDDSRRRRGKLAAAAAAAWRRGECHREGRRLGGSRGHGCGGGGRCCGGCSRRAWASANRAAGSVAAARTSLQNPCRRLGHGERRAVSRPPSHSAQQT
mmetsp:Transcript_131527/g.420758  ORF Transcript_131527/g.420758 Transcript_131527/m.420758 type:complete len:269 (-) Transcript_131527:38-844(-)